MTENIDGLEPFEKICRKICLNIPSECHWQWDHRRAMALVVFEKQDADLIYFPLLREFRDRWSLTAGEPDDLIAKLLDSEFGLLPGQTFFASPPIQGLVLFVAWWPWGEADKISMRVGLLSINGDKQNPRRALAHLGRWLPFDSAERAASQPGGQSTR